MIVAIGRHKYSTYDKITFFLKIERDEIKERALNEVLSRIDQKKEYSDKEIQHLLKDSRICIEHDTLLLKRTLDFNFKPVGGAPYLSDYLDEGYMPTDEEVKLFKKQNDFFFTSGDEKSEEPKKSSKPSKPSPPLKKATSRANTSRKNIAKS